MSVNHVSSSPRGNALLREAFKGKNRKYIGLLPILVGVGVRGGHNNLNVEIEYVP